MGILSWIFPSPEDKLDRARKKLAQGHYADARLDALDLGELRGAAEVVASAEEALCQLNLEAAVSWADADDAERVQHHLELAEAYRKPHLQDAFDDAHRRIRAAAEARAAAARARKEATAQRLAHVDERFREVDGEPAIPLPEGVSDEDKEALEARLAMLVDAYPEALRSEAITLGAAFVGAVLDLEDGDAASALSALLALPDDAPLVLHERARAAYRLGDRQAAARSWRAFAERAGGHHTIGQLHTGVMLAQVLTELGQIDEALALLERQRKRDPFLGGGLYASLLMHKGRLEEAENVLRGLLQKFGAQPGLYLMIAQARVLGGKRVAAMQALETSLRQSECEPGRCGYKPPDLATHRALATLYLEDGIEAERALELAEVARGLVQEPTWEDAYLAALVARANQESRWTDLAARLVQLTPPDDPRRSLLDTHLPISA